MTCLASQSVRLEGDNTGSSGLKPEQETTVSALNLQREWNCHCHFKGEAIKARGAAGHGTNR